MKTSKTFLESTTTSCGISLDELAVRLLSINDESGLLELLKKSIAEVNPRLSYVIAVMQSDKINFRVAESNVLSTFRMRVGKIIGKDPFQIDFPFKALSEEQIESFKTGRLNYFEGGIYDITMGKLNRTVAYAIEKLLKIQGVYSMGFSGGDEIYASATFFVPDEMCIKGELREGIKCTLESICNLFSIVFKRTRTLKELKINQEKLRQANAELEKLSDSKDFFLRLISHDIINSFNTTLGYLNLLSDDFEDFSTAEIKEYVERSLNSSEKVFELLENLLSWARSREGLLEPKSVAFAPEELVLSVIDLYHEKSISKSLEFITEFEEGVKIFTDYEMVNTVVRNLVANSIKFSKPNGKITVRVENIKTNGIVFGSISVEDKGVGMSDTQLSHLFDIGARRDTFGTAGEKGSGLGLLLCKEFIDLNSGTLSVSSAEKAGTKVTVSLPSSYS